LWPPRYTPAPAGPGQALHGLGLPEALLRAQVRRLGEDHDRVNGVGADAASARIAQGYLLVADGAGNVHAATPNLTRRYGHVRGDQP
jgi:hypothetical protein